jgi:hypothetical protein
VKKTQTKCEECAKGIEKRTATGGRFEIACANPNCRSEPRVFGHTMDARYAHRRVEPRKRAFRDE